jgi:hypothetical protein
MPNFIRTCLIASGVAFVPSAMWKIYADKKVAKTKTFYKELKKKQQSGKIHAAPTLSSR